MVITEDEIKKMLPKCQNGKAFGADEIPNEVLKNDAMVKLLTELFNLIFDLGVILDKWLLALVSSIPKGDSSDARNPLSYRGINLLSCCCKLYRNIINNRMTRYLENQNLLHDCQNDFRKGRSTEDHLFVLNSELRKMVGQKGKYIHSIY